MSLDPRSLDAYVREIAARVVGRRIEKVRPHGKWALRVELSSRELLFLDVSRTVGGLWLLTRADAVPDDSRDVEGPSRTAALLFKKHLEGARIEELTATSDRIVTLRTARAEVRLRPWGAPAATLVLDGAAVAHFGNGEQVRRDDVPLTSLRGATPFGTASASAGLGHREAWPWATKQPPDSRDPASFATHLVPSLRHPVPSNDVDEDGEAVVHLGSEAQVRRDDVPLTSLRGPSPFGSGPKQPPPTTTKPEPSRAFLTPPPGDDAANATAPPRLVPFQADGAAIPFPDFTTAAARLYVIHRRAELFRDRMQSRLSHAKSEVSRLTRLKAALERDRGRWPDPSQLRHHAEALLAAPTDVAPALTGARDVIALSIPDPRTGEVIEVRIQPRLTLPQNASALYERARNIERRKAAFDQRWATVISHLEAAERALEEAKAIRSLDEIEGHAIAPGPDPRGGGGRKRYLTSRGLEILFGRSAAENHDVTFKLAKREDLWFHVLDAPGGHVILRNPQGRANRADIAEAASLAAFLSERRTEADVDVQYTERKHVQPAGGGKGRVRVTHAEAIRVRPEDPAGRLRAR